MFLFIACGTGFLFIYLFIYLFIFCVLGANKRSPVAHARNVFQKMTPVLQATFLWASLDEPKSRAICMT